MRAPIAMGGLLVNAATAAVGGPAGDVLTGLNVNQTLQQTLVNSTPDDLRILNRKNFSRSTSPARTQMRFLCIRGIRPGLGPS
jgi:hypothetical protein